MFLGNLLSNFLGLFILFAVLQKPAIAVKKSYVVYLGAHSHELEATSADLDRVINSHTELLSSSLGSEEKAKDALIYSYKRHINGFAALLEEEEAAQIGKQSGVVSVFLNQAKKLHTTHSWEFLMLEKNDEIPSSSTWKKARFGEDTIIANLDTGVWPESKSFSGKGYGPIPSKWKGICQFNESVGPLCNRKLIGARYFNKGYAAYVGEKLNSSFATPRDTEGHGSHTLSTAGGNMVAGASVLGIGNGTAKGGSPRARVASYKVCWPPINGAECMDADIMSAFDAAIHDGVDVISLSVGGQAADYFSDAIAISSFHAVMNGVTVVASAGNDGPTAGTVSNVAPWILTVGASTIDRQFQSNVRLENGSILMGTSLSSPMSHNGFYPLISADDAAAAHANSSDALLCSNNTLDSGKVKGKIVVCLRGVTPRVEKGIEAARAGAVGMVLCNDKSDGNELIADAHFIPATQIKYTDAQILFAYMNSTSHPKGLITPPEAVIGVKPAPVMAAFSSRGPNTITPEILKPDVTAPGVNIIAAYSEAVSPTSVAADKRRTPYYVISGTSMSCPHVAGVVGLLRTLYPEWSPAAIKSAVITSARTRDNTVHPMLDASISGSANDFARGSGDVRPNRAMDPGLVYDMSTNDYLDFFCGAGYNQSMISMLTGSNYACPKNYSILNMNYPSITVPNLSGSVTVTRKVKNVGKPGRYACHVKQAPFFRISVEPFVLKFSKIGEEKSFKVTITSKGSKVGYQFGGLTWTDGTHYVRSPVVVAN